MELEDAYWTVSMIPPRTIHPLLRHLRGTAALAAVAAADDMASPS